MLKYNLFIKNYNYYFQYNYYLSLSIKSLNFFFKIINKFNLISLLKWLNHSNLLNDFIIFFTKKEYMYTKLKYSRVPQYDIASGASAALLAGLLGFIVTEKFGFELLDSGDFYNLVMYIGFLLLFLRCIIKIYNNNTASKNILNIFYNFYYFYLEISKIILKYIKFIYIMLRMWFK